MSICTRFHGLATSQQNNDFLVAQLGCGQWDCEHCAGKLRSQWRAKIINGINALGGNWSWFTLTAHSKTRGANKSIKNLRDAWDKIIKRMKRKFGKFAYVRVFEQHKDGSFHIHAIANMSFGDIKTRKSRKSDDVTKYSKWLADTAKELKLGYYTHADDIEMNDEKHAGFVASYVTKYMTKMSGEFIGLIGRARRIQTSQNWPKLPPKDETWEYTPQINMSRAIELNNDNIRIVDVSTGEVIDARYWQDDIYLYPPSANEQYLQWLEKLRNEQI